MPSPIDPVATDRKKLPKPVWILCWVSFFADVSSEMIYPLLPLFLVGVLGASMTHLGAIEGTSLFIVAMLSAYAGIRSDAAKSIDGRTRWIRWGYGLPVLGKSLMALATGWPMVLGGRWLDRLGKGLRGAPRDALISDAVNEDLRGRAFGLHRTMDTAGALMGLLVSALLLWLMTGQPTSDSPGEAISSAQPVSAWVFRSIIALGAILGLASWILTFYVRDPALSPMADADALSPPAEIQSQSVDAERDAVLSKSIALPRSFWMTILVLALFSLANSSDTFLLLRVRDLGYSPLAVVGVYALYNVTYAIFSYPFGAISDQLGRWRMIAAGWLIYAAVYAGMAFLSNPSAWLTWPLMAMYGLYMALTDGIGKALIADHAPRGRRGTSMGIYHGITGITALLASLAAGLMWDLSGPRLTFLAGSSFAVLALITLFAFKKSWIPA